MAARAARRASRFVLSRSLMGTIRAAVLDLSTIMEV